MYKMWKSLQIIYFTDPKHIDTLTLSCSRAEPHKIIEVFENNTLIDLMFITVTISHFIRFTNSLYNLSWFHISHKEFSASKRIIRSNMKLFISLLFYIYIFILQSILFYYEYVNQSDKSQSCLPQAYSDAECTFPEREKRKRDCIYIQAITLKCGGKKQ